MVKKVKEIPEGIKILAFVYFAGAFALAIFGMIAFSLADGIRNTDSATLAAANLGQMHFSTVVIAGIFLILLAILEYLVAREILKAKAWARAIMGLLSVMSFVFAVRSIASGMYASGSSAILLNGLIVWYLFFKDSTKKFFK